MIDFINVLYGNNKFLVQKRLEEMIKITNVDEINISSYDLIETKNDDVLEDLRTVSFFSERKVVVVKNLQEVLKNDQSFIDDWIKYITKPNPDVFLIILLDELLNEKHPLGKALFKNSYIEEIADLTKSDYPKYIKTYLKSLDFTIDDKAVKELLIRTDNNLTLTTVELEKLMLYNFDTEVITYDSVISLVSRNLEENIYELVNSFLSRNNNKTIEIYYDLLARSEDPIRIMNSLVNKIRELIHTKLLLERGYTQDEVAKHFNVKSGLAFYLIKTANQISLTELETHAKNLANLDVEIKSGQIDKKIGLEIFILGA